MKTLGMFAKQPVPGRVKTRLAQCWGADRAAQLYEAMLLDLCDRISVVAERRVIAYAPDDVATRTWFQEHSPHAFKLWPQPNGDLGQRIVGFFAEHLQAPESHVVLIGSDSPSLPLEVIDSAFAHLEQHDCVIGPAADGGYYLIGLSGHAVKWNALFEGIPWSTSEVLMTTVRRIQEQSLGMALLPVWYDIDSLDDVRTLFGHMQAQRLAGQGSELLRTEPLLAEWLQSASETAAE